MKICCFAGHSDIYSFDDLEQKLYDKCKDLIENYNVAYFRVGHYGDFDRMAYRIVKKLKEIYPHIRLELVLPYLTQEINEYKEEYYENYDSMIIAEIPPKTPIRFRILKCNQYMVDTSDYLIAFVDYSFGGAAKTLEYAQRKKKITIYNLGTYVF